MSTLWLVVTRTCNLACPYCYQGSHLEVREGLERFMSERVWEAGLEWALGWPSRESPVSVTLYGGEPLIAWPSIERWVPRWTERFAAEGKRLRWSVTTNGTLLTPDRRAFLDRFDMGVLLSLDGPQHVHDRTRVHHDGRPSWREIDPEGLLAWRPWLPIAWSVDPARPPEPRDLDALVELGFRTVNVNLTDTPAGAEELLRLQDFFRRLGTLVGQGVVQSNWSTKLSRILVRTERMEKPCGTGLGMLALAPEGDLFVSQEMAFTVYAPGKPPALAERMKVGNVFEGIDTKALERMAGIRTSQMRSSLDCSSCLAQRECFGGCHCRYVGQRRNDLDYRFDVPVEYCRCHQAALTGMLQGAVIARTIRPFGRERKRRASLRLHEEEP